MHAGKIFAIISQIRLTIQELKRYYLISLERYSSDVNDAGWSSPVARRAHNPKVAGSSPAPAPIRLSKAADPLGSAAFGALDENIIQGFLVCALNQTAAHGHYTGTASTNKTQFNGSLR